MKRALSWWAQNFLWAEFVLASAVSIGFTVWLYGFGGIPVVEDVISGNRGSIYGALASVFGSLLGFGITAESIVIGLSGSERLTIVRESKHYETLWKVFIAAIRALGFATAVSLLALVLDRDKHPIRPCLIIAAFGTVLASLRLLRCIWVLENVVRIVSSPSQEREAGE